MVFLCTAKNAPRAPSTPNIAPLAPAPMAIEFIPKLSTLPARPAMTYITANLRWPYVLSTRLPNSSRPSPLNTMCGTSAWRNIAVNRRQYCPSAISGLNIAP